MSNPLEGADGRVTFESIMGFMKRGNRDRIGGPPQPTTGYTRNVTPPAGQPARVEDAFPESCCEGSGE